MAYYNKIGLLVLSDDETKFLVCEKYPEDETALYLMPGGKIEKGENNIECLVREIKEELNCEVDIESLVYLNEYIGPSATSAARDVSIKLYQGKLIGHPVPSSEIEFIHWIGKENINNLKVSPIIRNKIIPDLIKRKILK